MQNVVTNLILQDEIYVIIYSLTSEHLQDDIQKIRTIQNNESLLDSKFSLQSQQIKKELWLDPEARS